MCKKHLFIRGKKSQTLNCSYLRKTFIKEKSTLRDQGHLVCSEIGQLKYNVTETKFFFFRNIRSRNASKLKCKCKGYKTNFLYKYLPKFHFRDRNKGFRRDNLWINILPSILCFTDFWQFGKLGVIAFFKNAKAWDSINSKCLCNFL